jgi:hypothetical protein
MKPFMRGAAVGAFAVGLIGSMMANYDFVAASALLSIAAQFISNNS